jgi:hypothetical protein
MADKGNILLDFEVPITVDVNEGAKNLVDVSNRMLINIQDYLKNVRKIVAKYGKSELVAVLGGPIALELEAIYNRSIAFIEATASGVDVPPLEEE